MDELNVFVFGGSIPETQIKQKLLTNLKCPVNFEHAVNAADIAHIVNSKKYDVIFAKDDSTGLQVLEYASLDYPDTPIIFLFDIIDDDRAIELINKGAADCVVKEDVEKLSSVICREIVKSSRITAQKQPASINRRFIQPGRRNIKVLLEKEHEMTEPLDVTARKKSEAALWGRKRRTLTLIDELKRNNHDLTEEAEALRRLNRISLNYLKLNNLRLIYEEILDAAIDLTHADKGTLQLYVEKENCLKLVAQRGFNASNIQNFEADCRGRFASGKPIENCSRLIVGYGEITTYYSETELQIIRDEQIRYFQSTPIISTSGTPYGMLNTHYCSSHSFNERELKILDTLARYTADFIDKKKAEVALELSELNAVALVRELKKSDLRKNEFLFKLSHELRNPLATIVAAVSLIDISNEISQIQNASGILRSETNHLRHLIDDLLEVTRITNNKIHIKKMIINLRLTVLDTANNLMPQFQRKNINLTTEITDDPVVMMADPVRIKQMIENLLSNALSYSSEGGNVLLSLSKDNGFAILRVKDNGIGISPQELPFLFNPFYQAERPQNKPDTGLGLGLTIVKGMAEVHGGTVSAYSKGLSCGSTFTISLPIIDVPPTDEGQTDGNFI